MTTRTRVTTLAAFALAVLLVTACTDDAGRSGSSPSGETEPPTEAHVVEVRDEGVVVSSANADDAIARLSQRVGYEVRVPKSVPASLELKGVDSAVGPEGVLNPLKLAFLLYGPRDEAKRGQAMVRIEQTGFRFAPPDGGAQKLDLGVRGVEAYYELTDRGVMVYSIFTVDRGFVVIVRGAEAPNQAQMREMVASLVQ